MRMVLAALLLAAASRLAAAQGFNNFAPIPSSVARQHFGSQGDQ